MRDMEEREHDRVLGTYIRQARLQARISVRGLAVQAHIAPSSISRLEHGSRMVRTVALKRIADVLQLDLADLLALRGIEVWPSDLCTLEAFLRSHSDLPDVAIRECAAAVVQIAHKYQEQSAPPFELPIQNHLGVTAEPVRAANKRRRSEGGE